MKHIIYWLCLFCGITAHASVFVWDPSLYNEDGSAVNGPVTYRLYARQSAVCPTNLSPAAISPLLVASPGTNLYYSTNETTLGWWTWYVTAVAANGAESDYSEPCLYRTRTTPGQPQAVTLVLSGRNDLTSTWSIPSTNADGTATSSLVVSNYAGWGNRVYLGDIKGYQALLGPSPGLYTRTQDVGFALTYTWTNLAKGIYYGAARACNWSNQPGVASAEASARITAPIKPPRFSATGF